MTAGTTLRFVSYLSLSLGLLLLGAATVLGLFTVVPALPVPATAPLSVGIAAGAVVVTGAGVYRFLAA